VLEMHVEVPPGQTLAEAHERVSQLERNVQSRMPEVVEVVTHIEPAFVTAAVPANLEQCEAVTAQALSLLQARFPGLDWHQIRVQPSPNGELTLTAHVILSPQTTVEAAHTLAEQAELLLRTSIPHLERVTIHTEPPD
ncbi:MAG TPA: cation transporter dimerization domain-containing protein, partial [Phototrophicaceae bacterium]|nr:cation transporter dimerization domain-containing protein [Phototrophicaceae bacterium]